MEHLTLFRAWQLTIDQKNLLRIQEDTGMRTLWIYVVPKAILTIYCLLLCTYGDDSLIWSSLLMLGISWASSFLIQIPLQLKIQRSGDRMALERLLKTTWVRTIAMVGHFGIVLYLALAKV